MANPVLYILMRTDMPSMNPGKAMAQASHATSAFLNDMECHKKNAGGRFAEVLRALEIWQAETRQGFGTVLVLGCTGRELDVVVGQSGDTYLANYVIDPTYPMIVPNDVAELIPSGEATVAEDFEMENHSLLYVVKKTCGYAFVSDKTLVPSIITNLKLHP